MSKAKKQSRERGLPVPPPAEKTTQPASSHAIRETIESIVIAFVLAFLFRTFEAEAFVIPTGSMAPTLMGRHKDVDCPQCGYRYQVNASEEESENSQRRPAAILGGMCPICRYVMPMRPDLPSELLEGRSRDIPWQRSYSGDRILVNKYVYAFRDPERWDVVVFKFPGDAKVNYIKRLVGLPGETVRIHQGDLYLSKASDAAGDFDIARKPANKILAMRQLVHDTEHEPLELRRANWPLRWQNEDNAWKIETEPDDNVVRQRFTIDNKSGGESWLRYRHIVPDNEVWQQVTSAALDSSEIDLRQWNEFADKSRPQLITDANPYNARISSDRIGRSLEVDPSRLGLHWVGDLMVDADVEVESDRGQLLIELVKSGRRFTCTIDIASGEATLGISGLDSFAPKSKTPLVGPGSYRVSFANFDSQLSLWIDGEPVAFGDDAKYSAAEVFGSGENLNPVTSESEPGDLAPARIGAREAKMAISRLQVWRDIYYIAVRASRPGLNPSEQSPYWYMDYVGADQAQIERMLDDPSQWSELPDRRTVDFPLNDEQLFVMGDNSAESSDARLWYSGTENGGIPGGDYLERRLLIGKALCVYWPHSWNRIPGTPIPFPLFPNFADMRLVR